MEGDEVFKDKTVDFNYKLILVGNSMVGKTCITNRYVEETFNEDEARSRKVQIYHKLFKIPDSIPEQVADLHIWDTLGQEKFQSIAKIFFKGTVGAFLVFDLSNRESFEQLTKWYDIVNESC